MKVLLAGDGFVRNDLLAEAVTGRLRTMPSLSSIELPWPTVPYGPVAEVDEAADCEEQLVEVIADAEVAITQMAPLTERVLDAAPDLRLVVCTRGGPVNVNVDAAAEREVAVSCTPGRNAVAAAEYTLLLMLAAMRRLPEAHTSVAAGQWRSDMYGYDECGAEIAGSVVGLVGYGEIGARVAALVRGMGGRVLVHDPYVAADSAGPGVELVSLRDLLQRADVVSLHARLTAQTQRMIGAAQLGLLRPGAVLVNTARGGLLDYAAAAAALASGTLGALALDVFAEEPVNTSSPLLGAPRVVLSPHLAGATKQTAGRAATMAADEVHRYCTGEPLEFTVNGVDPRERR